MRYLISYDLKAKRVNNYENLDDALEKLGAERVLKSQWVIRHKNTTTVELCRRILDLGILADNDQLLVTNFTDWDASPSFPTNLDAL